MLPNENISTKIDTGYAQIIRLSFPIFLSILIMQISFLCNTIFLGQTNEANLAANGIAGIYYMTLSAMCVGFNNGVQILLSRYAGQDNPKAMGNVFTHAFVLGLLFSILLIGLSYIVVPTLFETMIENAEIRESAQSFILLRVFGLPIFVIQQLANQFFIATQRSKLILPGIIVSTAVNILMDYTLIFGHFGCPQLGIRGAAIASIAAEFSFFILNYCFIYFYKLQEKFFLIKSKVVDYVLAKNIIVVSFPVVVQAFFSIGAWLLFFFYIEHLGKQESAITQICRSVFGVAGAFSWALATTTESMISNVLGQKKYGEIKYLIGKLMLVGFCSAVIMSLPYIIAPRFVLGLYTDQQALIDNALAPLKIVILSNILLSFSTVVFNAVLGTGHTRYTLLFEGISILCYIAYIHYFIEIKRCSLATAWMSEFVYWMVLLVLSLGYFKFINWRKAAERLGGHH